MKERKLYVCEICNAEYNAKEKAIACEKSHKKIKEVKATQYVHSSANAKGFPMRISLTMTDGSVATYKYDYEGYRERKR